MKRTIIFLLVTIEILVVLFAIIDIALVVIVGIILFSSKSFMHELKKLNQDNYKKLSQDK